MIRRLLHAAGRCALLLAFVPALAAQTTGFDRFMMLVQGRAGRPSGVTRVRWLPNGLGYLDVARDSATHGTVFSKVDPATGAKSPLFDRATVTRLVAEFSKVSGTAIDRIPFDDFRYESNGTAISFEQGGNHYLFDLTKPGLRKLLLPAKVGPLNQGTTEAGKFSPDFNYYAFVRDYDNLWLCDTRTGEVSRLTTGTSEDNLIGFLNAGEWYVWSPDSRHIGYLKANQSGLYRYPLLKDLDRHSTVEYFRYPFATDPNPPLEVRIVDATTKGDVKVEAGTIENPFLRELAWFDDGSELTYQVVNQWESRLELKAVDPAGQGARTILVDRDSAYLDELHNFRQLKNQRFIWSSQQSGWRQLYLYDRRGTLVKQLTSGDWETGNILGVDETAGWIYFEGATRRGLEHHLFRVKTDGTGQAQLTTEEGVHRLEMDPAARWVLDRHSAIGRAPAVTLRSADGKRLRDLATADVSSVSSAGFPAPELLDLKTTDGQPMHGILFRPADFDSTRKYPLVVEVYGGPHTKAVRNEYQTTGFNAAIAQLGFLVAQFDARGTIDQGKRFQTGNYLRLGQVDVDDQAGAVKQLVLSRPYVDGQRVGVTGISHGGYMTLMMMLRYPDVYQVGVAGAPITDVRNGPRQYIGRFMRTPEANPDGYAQADILPRAGNLKGRLLLVHGTDDHNAVLTNTMQLARRFIELGKPVDMMIYPNGVHVLEGADAIHNLRNTISYFLEHLRPAGWEATRGKIWGEGS
jgi:dipeptidyl-peptidase-4